MEVAEALKIRLAQPDDLAALDALFARSYPALLKQHYPPSVLVLAVPLLARAQPGLLASGSYWVAEAADGALVGAGGWTRAAPPGGTTRQGSGNVRHVVSDARRLRQGIGRRLMGQALTAARRAGLARLDCLSTRNAVPFYAALGFTAGEEVEIELRPGIAFAAVRMRLTL